MELSLNQQYLNYYETVVTRTINHEETMETIVPDAKPDILSIADTEGRVSLKAKQAQEGRCELAGIIGLSALYTPDDGAQLERMDANIPFVAVVDDPAISSAGRVVAQPTVLSAETRLLNPRKVLVRAEIAITVRIYVPRSNAICASVEAEPAAGIEQKNICETAYVVTAVEEKPFSIAEDLTVSAARPAVSDVLKYRTSLVTGESKVIGNKLVFKGDLLLQVVYCSVEGTVENISFTLPFSQIMEISGVGEDAQATICIFQTDADCNVYADDGRALQFSISLLAQAVVAQTRTYCLLTDIYSTEQHLETEEKSYRFDHLVERAERTQSIREIIETLILPVTVLDAYASAGPVKQSRESGQSTLTCDVTTHVLYEGDDGNHYLASQRFEVPQIIEGGSDCRCYAMAQPASDMTAVPVAGGIEVRIPVAFQYETIAPRELGAVSDVRFAGQRERGGARPSIVLRSVNDESLWDIAKGYGITRGDIMQANDLAGEDDVRGKILLIPQRR